MKKRIARILLASVCLVLPLLSCGCLGMMVRSVSTKDISPADAATKAGPIATDKARVWVYMVGGGPNAWNTMGAMDFITFNRTVYSFGGHSFFITDLPADNYQVTVTRVSVPSFGLHAKFKTGDFRKQLHLQGGKEYFIRLQGQNKFGSEDAPWQFNLVDQAEATSQIKPLSFWSQYKIEDEQYIFQE